MPRSRKAVTGLAADLISEHTNAMRPTEHHELVARYLKGEHDLPYMQRGAKAEYKTLTKKSITNWLRLVVDTFAKDLFVDGYRAAKSTSNSKAWDSNRRTAWTPARRSFSAARWSSARPTASSCPASRPP